MASHTLKIFSNGDVSVLVPTSGVYGVVKLDYDQQWPAEQIPDPTRRFHVSRPTRNNAPRYTKGLPATARFLDDKIVVMTEEIQRWMFGMCWNSVPGMTEYEAKQSWRSLTADDRYITNFAGSTTKADYINGTNIDKGPMNLVPMGTGGTILKIIGEDNNFFGEDCWIFEAINMLGNFKKFTPLTHPWLFYQPTNSVRVEIMKPNGVWSGAYREDKSDPLPQFRGKSIVPVVNVGKSYNYLPKWRIRILSPGEPFPSPFVP
jgi:hypothetical protein